MEIRDWLELARIQLRREEGQTMTEYGVLLALIAVIVIVLCRCHSSSVRTLQAFFTTVSRPGSRACTSGGPPPPWGPAALPTAMPARRQPKAAAQRTTRRHEHTAAIFSTSASPNGQTMAEYGFCSPDLRSCRLVTFRRSATAINAFYHGASRRSEAIVERPADYSAAKTARRSPSSRCPADARRAPARDHPVRDRLQQLLDDHRRSAHRRTQGSRQPLHRRQRRRRRRRRPRTRRSSSNHTALKVTVTSHQLERRRAAT